MVIFFFQAELDREFAMALQNQNESGMMDDPGQESIDEEYRYHSAFGDIGHHRVNSPRRRHRDSRHRDTGPAPSGWHLYDPVRMSRNRDRGILYKDSTMALRNLTLLHSEQP